MQEAPRPWQFWIDTGGTFTDCLALDPAGRQRRLKVLSTGAVRGTFVEVVSPTSIQLRGMPEVPPDFFAGFTIAATDGRAGGTIAGWDPAKQMAALSAPLENVPRRGEAIDLSAQEEAPVLAMRILTGAAPGKPLPPAELKLATTRGTNALLEGKGARVAFFVTAGFGDLLRIGDQRRPDLFALRVEKPPPLHGPVVEVPERLAADGSVLQSLDLAALEPAVEALRREGVNVAAVALMHSYCQPRHEHELAQFLRSRGFEHVSISSELAPFIKIVPRAETTVVDALLAPVMENYLDGVGRFVDARRFFVMTSAGGLVRRGSYRSKDSLLSGPAGGVAGASFVAKRAGFERVITFDMGGTSTDVARIDGGLNYRYQHTVGTARVCAPAVYIESVAAGGGSICRFDGAALVVGPESAGAHPGPACYGAGGPLTLTDVNLLLGRLDASRFGVPVFPDRAEARLREVADEVSRQAGREVGRDELLRGFLDIADERMAEAIRRLSVREGYDPQEYALVAFGGAGGLHACAVASRLGMTQILFPADSGLLSAFGLKASVPQRFAEKQVLRPLSEIIATLPSLFRELEAQARAALQEDGVAADAARPERAELELRLAGQESTLTLPLHPVAEIQARFHDAYESRFGYRPTDRPLEVVSARVVVAVPGAIEDRETFPDYVDAEARDSGGGVFARDALASDAARRGPFVVQDRFSTLAVAEDWVARVGEAGSIVLERRSAASMRSDEVRRDDVIELELFTCRFLALVEEMGALLQRCALSVNVKERLDFSCALLDSQGRLVANAPHIPVHLGAMGLCVRRLMESIALEPGDVVVTNHPRYGGSHLPDVTLVAPVHTDDGILLGFVANRAHHAELGGIRPGSMPPRARCLAEEGVVIAPFYLARAGQSVDWTGLRAILAGGSHPSRAIEENLADVHAQLAAVRRGTEALRELATTCGAATVARFMSQLYDRAANTLAVELEKRPAAERSAHDALDDGTPLAVAIRRRGSRWCIDFTGTGDVHPGNLNATPAIVHSAVVYVLRLLAAADLPLNDGLLRDVELMIPRGLLAPDFTGDPAHCPAVVGGNVETSQRVVDLLLQAWRLAACSQGTMNNLVLGNEQFSYYETIGGGTGAGPGFAGCSGVHSHMTNTAITDPEVLERRLPLRLERFAIHPGSGGAGRWRGGDGIERRMRALAAMSLSLLTQRRVSGPPGGEGGAPGRPGAQWIERVGQAREDLPALAEAELEAGDVLVVRTPGGGGWSRPEFHSVPRSG